MSSSADNKEMVIVMVTTFNRPKLLGSRSLLSISNQTVNFDGIILVDNSNSASVQKQNNNIFLEQFPEGEYQDIQALLELGIKAYIGLIIIILEHGLQSLMTMMNG